MDHYVHSKWVDLQKDLYPGEQIRELKRLSDTRWACRVDACRVIRDRFAALVRLLDEIGNETHADRAVDAKGLLAQLNAQFVMKLVVLTDILVQTSKLSNMLQSTDVDLAKAAELTEVLISQLQDQRSNQTSFDPLWNEVQTTVESHGFDIEDIDPTQRKRKRRMPQRLEEAILLEHRPLDGVQGDAQTHATIKDEVRAHFVYRILDRMISEMKRRFNSDSCAIMKSMQ